MKLTNTGKADLYNDIELQKKNIPKQNQEINNLDKVEKKFDVEKVYGKKSEKISAGEEQNLDKVLKELNENNKIIDKGIIFEKNYDYDRIVVQIINKETGEMIKQLPAEHVLEFNRLYQDFTGMMFDITV